MAAAEGGVPGVKPGLVVVALQGPEPWQRAPAPTGPGNLKVRIGDSKCHSHPQLGEILLLVHNTWDVPLGMTTYTG